MFIRSEAVVNGKLHHLASMGIDDILDETPA
jgi:hypothetical protein